MAYSLLCSPLFGLFRPAPLLLEHIVEQVCELAEWAWVPDLDCISSAPLLVPEKVRGRRIRAGLLPSTNPSPLTSRMEAVWIPPAAPGCYLMNSMTISALGSAVTESFPSGRVFTVAGGNSAAARSCLCCSGVGKSGFPMHSHNFMGLP